MSAILTKEKLRCYFSQIGGAIDHIKDDLGLFQGNVNLVTLGGAKMVLDDLQEERVTPDIDFYCAEALELAMLDSDNFHSSPAATGISYALRNGEIHAEFFNRIHPDLSSKTNNTMFAEEVEERCRNKKARKVAEFQRCNIYVLPDDLFVVNKISAYNPERRAKDVEDVRTLLDRKADTRLMRDISDGLRTYGLTEKYNSLLGKEYPV